LATIKESNDNTIVNFVRFYNADVYLQHSADRGHKNKNSLNRSVDDVAGALG
jgi:hypothetical protein